MTRDEFQTLYNAKNFEAINAEHARSSPEEQAQLLTWMNEANPPENLYDSLNVEDMAAQVEASENEAIERQAEINREQELARRMFQESGLSPQERQRQANILRAKRSNLKRRISKKFRPYLPFTAKQAAEAIGANEIMMENYLRSEASVAGREITSPEPGKYMLIDLFA